MKKLNPYLLPENVEPVHYYIELKPDLEKFTFSGLTVVDLKVNKATSQITLHAVDLEILRAEFEQYPYLGVAQITFNKKMETVTLIFPRELIPGAQATLHLRFTGELNDKMHGFYRTSYEFEGKKCWGGATQFESTDARRAFPCWDEPAKKATFEIRLIVPKDMVAVSNMPVKNETYLEDGFKTVSFERSPKMSTYLVAFVVAHMNYIEDKDHNCVPLKLYAIPGKETHGLFAMESDKASLEFYERRFGISYKSIAPKKDMIALPDFASGAMENLGAVTYRETAALIDPANNTAAARERVAEVVMHENAHMWFGDLVTMKWWNGLWLNEGFATFMSHCAMHDKFPEWDVWTGYVAGDFRSALYLDSLKNSHPIEIDVKDPYEIREIFDSITYAKGSVVNRMLEQYLGEDFWKGLQLYLKRFSYNNADTVDLWAALEEASGKPVKDMMARYTKQPGYPVVTVKISEKGLKMYKIAIAQQRFLADGSKDTKNLKWNIPINILCPEVTDMILIESLDKKNKDVTVPGASSWIKLNPGQSGFYRVAYSDELWNPLVDAVKHGELSAIDRIGLLDDSMALAKAGYIKTSQALDMIKAQETDKEFDGNVWSVVIGNLNSLAHILENDAGGKKQLAVFARKMLRPVADKLGWKKLPQEEHTDTLLRSMAIGCMGNFEDNKTVINALIKFDSADPIDPDLKNVIYSLAAKFGYKGNFEKLLKIYDSTNDAREKERIQMAMGGFKSEELIKKVIEFALSERVRKQDFFRIMVMLGKNPDARSIAWNFLKENWEDFHQKYEGNLTLLVRTLEGVTNGFTDKKNLADIKQFFKAHPLKEAKRTMKQVIETIETNIKWRNRDIDEIKNWLALR